MRPIFTYYIEQIEINNPNNEAVIVIPASCFDILNFTIKSATAFNLSIEHYTENFILFKTESLFGSSVYSIQLLSPARERLAYFIVIKVDVAQKYDVILESITSVPL